MPNIRGRENPQMSASMTPTTWPRAARATARLAVTDDLPTPPLPEAMPRTFAVGGKAVVAFVAHEEFAARDELHAVGVAGGYTLEFTEGGNGRFAGRMIASGGTAGAFGVVGLHYNQVRFLTTNGHEFTRMKT